MKASSRARVFEVQLICDPLSEDQESSLMTTYDASVGGHGGVTVVTLTVQGEDGLSAMRGLLADLWAAGVTVQRVVDDLVTRNQIASRTGVTSQAVGAWARGDRKRANPFPVPFLLAGGGLWRWPDVDAWLGRQGRKTDGPEFLSWQEVVIVNSGLTARIDPTATAN